MFPGFVCAYKDEQEYVHLYFFPGITDNKSYYYKDIDLINCKIPVDTIINSDKSKDYILYSKHILKITCKLIASDNSETVITLSL